MYATGSPATPSIEERSERAGRAVADSASGCASTPVRARRPGRVPGAPRRPGVASRCRVGQSCIGRRLLEEQLPDRRHRCCLRSEVRRARRRRGSPDRRSTSTPVEPSERRTSRSTTASPTTRFSRRTSGSQRGSVGETSRSSWRARRAPGRAWRRAAGRGSPPPRPAASRRPGTGQGRRGGPVEAAEQLRQPRVAEELGRLEQRAGDPRRFLAMAVAPQAGGTDGVVVRPDAADVIADGVEAGHVCWTGSGCPSQLNRPRAQQRLGDPRGPVGCAIPLHSA